MIEQDKRTDAQLWNALDSRPHYSQDYCGARIELQRRLTVATEALARSERVVAGMMVDLRARPIQTSPLRHVAEASAEAWTEPANVKPSGEVVGPSLGRLRGRQALANTCEPPASPDPVVDAGQSVRAFGNAFISAFNSGGDWVAVIEADRTAIRETAEREGYGRGYLKAQGDHRHVWEGIGYEQAIQDVESRARAIHMGAPQWVVTALRDLRAKLKKGETDGA